MTPIDGSNKRLIERDLSEVKRQRNNSSSLGSVSSSASPSSSSSSSSSSSQTTISAIFEENITIKPKLTAAEKLNKNRIAALTQQKSQEPLNFQISNKSVIPTNYTKFVENLNKKVEFTIDAQFTHIGPHQVGIAACQGLRETMEDTYSATLITFFNQGRVILAPLYVICDGHGQSYAKPGRKKAADFVINHFPDELNNQLSLLKNCELNDGNIREALKQAVRKTSIKFNQHYLNGDSTYGSLGHFHQDGTTLIASLILNGTLYTANVGDSSACIVYPTRTEQANEVAKPEIQRYKNKIEQLGGYVIKDEYGTFRVNGFLAPARAIGDQWILGEVDLSVIISDPKITAYPLEGGFLVLSSDGLDVATINEVGEAITAMAHRQLDVLDMALNLVYSATRICNSDDNVTVLVIKLPPLVQDELIVWQEPEDIYYQDTDTSDLSSDSDISSDFEYVPCGFNDESSFANPVEFRLVSLHANAQLKIYPTMGDGSCAFHGFVGTNENGIYQCLDVVSERKKFCDWLREMYQQHKLPNEIKNVIIDYFTNFHLAPAYFKANIQDQYTKFADGYDQLSNSEKDARLEDFVNDVSVMEAYIDNMGWLGTYLLQDELTVVGNFYQKRVLLFQTDWSGAQSAVCSDPSVFEEGFTLGENDVCIWFEGRHFERAEFLKI